MKTVAVTLLFALCVAMAQAGSLKELLRSLLTEDLEEKSLYMVKTKTGGIKGDLQTINQGSCGKGCIFQVTVTDWASQKLAAPVQEVTYPGRFEFTNLPNDRVLEIKACPKQSPEDCGTIIYCQLDTGDNYTTDHECTTKAPEGQNAVISKIRSLLDQLKE